MNDYFEGALTATGGQMYTNLKTIFPGGGMDRHAADRQNRQKIFCRFFSRLV